MSVNRCKIIPTLFVISSDHLLAHTPAGREHKYRFPWVHLFFHFHWSCAESALHMNTSFSFRGHPCSLCCKLHFHFLFCRLISSVFCSWNILPLYCLSHDWGCHDFNSAPANLFVILSPLCFSTKQPQIVSVECLNYVCPLIIATWLIFMEAI